MRLRSGGIDIYYIDESHDRNIYVVTAIGVPFLRVVGGQWHIVWNDRLRAAKEWRKRIKQAHDIPTTKELHGVKLASGRGNFHRSKHNFPKPKAMAIYRRILEAMDFLPSASIMSATATRATHLYGNQRLEGALYALFQRMRSRCKALGTNAITFFDEGHPEYRKLYRQAQVYLPTGSRYETGTRNLPLDMFTKDGNEKNSKHCFFTQAADLVAYAVFLRLKAERAELEEWQARYRADNLYDSLPARLKNTRASPTRDAILRL